MFKCDLEGGGNRENKFLTQEEELILGKLISFSEIEDVIQRAESPVDWGVAQDYQHGYELQNVYLKAIRQPFQEVKSQHLLEIKHYLVTEVDGHDVERLAQRTPPREHFLDHGLSDLPAQHRLALTPRLPLGIAAAASSVSFGCPFQNLYNYL